MSRRKSGKCKCDVPNGAHDVRKIRVCWWCDDFGLDLFRFGWAHYHVRCLLKIVDWRTFAWMEMRQRRTRLCCLGPRQMKRLLHDTYDDGATRSPAVDW